MKTVKHLAIPLLLINFGCSSTQHANKNYDDVYLSADDATPSTNNSSAGTASPDAYTPQEQGDGSSDGATEPQTNRQTKEVVNGEDGNTYITNNYYDADNSNYDPDDYYDYSYAVRMKRFHSPMYGYGYYDNYYTNRYWYSYDPWDWGTSVYLGYPWWGISYNYYTPGISVSFNWGYPSFWNNYNWYYPGDYSYHCHGYYNTYAHYGYGYYPYGYAYGYNNGYNNGYWNGYNDGYYGYSPSANYYNSYDQTVNTYYGPRKSYSSSGKKSNNTLGEKYEQALVPHKEMMNIEKVNVSKVAVEKNTGKVESINNGNTKPVFTEKAGAEGINSKNPVKTDATLHTGTIGKEIKVNEEDKSNPDRYTPVYGTKQGADHVNNYEYENKGSLEKDAVGDKKNHAEPLTPVYNNIPRSDEQSNKYENDKKGGNNTHRAYEQGEKKESGNTWYNNNNYRKQQGNNRGEYNSKPSNGNYGRQVESKPKTNALEYVRPKNQEGYNKPNTYSAPPKSPANTPAPAIQNRNSGSGNNFDGGRKSNQSSPTKKGGRQ